MIIIGYQGIGKSSTVKENKGEYIDLESSNFKDSKGNRPSDWYIYYCNVANDLSKQGYNVFVSSHDVVRKELSKSKEKVIVVHPDLSLKDEWIERLQKRYDKTHLDKDKFALLNAKDRFVANNKELSVDAKKYGYDDIIITTTNYKLHDLLAKHNFSTFDYLTNRLNKLNFSKRTIKDWFYDYGMEDKEFLEDIYNVYSKNDLSDKITQDQFNALLRRLKK